MRIRNKRDFWAGILFISTGLLFSSFAVQYELGTLSRMGPGWFPGALGLLLMVLGTIVVVGSASARATESELPSFRLRELLLVLGGVAAFAALVPSLGLIVSAVIMLLVVASASHEFSFRETTISILALVSLSYLVFVRGLGLQLPTWPVALVGG